MKKIFFLVTLSIFATNLFAQQVDKERFQKATDLLADRTKTLLKLGYEIKAATIRGNWGTLKMEQSDLISYKTDTVFAESYVICSKRSYFSNSNGTDLTVSKITDGNNSSKPMKISVTSFNLVSTTTKTNDAVDIFKCYFKPQPNESRNEYGNSYSFEMFLMDEVREDQTIGSKKPFIDYGKAVITIIYVKNKN